MTFGSEPDSAVQCLRASQRSLVTCCRSQVPVTLMSPDTGIVSHGFFHQVDNATLTVRLGSDQCPLLSDPFCCATYTHKGQQNFFFTSIVGVREVVDRELILALPQSFVVEKRRSIRITVPQSSEFHASMRVDNRRCAGEVININLQGALVEFEELVAVKLETPVQLTLSLQDEVITVPACPVRRERSRLGFAFEGVGELDWKTDLQRMLKQIDRDWINEQSRINNIPRPYIDLRLRDPVLRSSR